MNENARLQVETLTNGPFAENCYLVADRRDGKGILIDPGDESVRLLARVRELGITVTEIVNTHGHVDHAGAVAELKRALGVPFAIHPGDRPVLEQMPLAARMFGLGDKEVPEINRELAEDDTITAGGLEAKVLHTPGHSPGGCCFYFEKQATVFVGDTLFAGSIGRSDLPGGDLPTLLSSIRTHLLSLPDSVVVYSGHGPETDISSERKLNPFLQGGFADP